jgi:hypothetical protein
MFDLKRYFNYSYPEQEEMLPFEREVLLSMIKGETSQGQAPEEGWRKATESLKGVDVMKAMAKGRKV